MPLSIPGADGNAIVGGYNISKLVQTAERLKNYRIRRNLSQAKLSELICRNTVGELKFSQTFLCRCVLFDFCCLYYTNINYANPKIPSDESDLVQFLSRVHCGIYNT